MTDDRVGPVVDHAAVAVVEPRGTARTMTVLLAVVAVAAGLAQAADVYTQS